MWGYHTQRQFLKWQNLLQKEKKKTEKKLFFVDSVEHLNFVAKKDV